MGCPFCMNPLCNGECAHAFYQNIERSRIVRDNPGETVFKGVGLEGGGDSHFSFVKSEKQFHVTTRLPGGITLHDDI